MAYPAYIGNGGIFAEGDYSVSPNFQATVQNNDIAFVQLLDADNDTFTIPTGDGWALVDEDGSVASASTSWMWKRCDGSEGGTSQTFASLLNAGAGVYGTILIYRGCKTSGIPYESKAMTSVNQGTSAAIPSCEALGDERLVIALISVEDNVSVGVGSGYTEDFELQSTFGGDASLQGQSQQANSETIASTAAALGGNDYHGVVVLALIPAPSLADYTLVTSVGEYNLIGKDSSLLKQSKMSTEKGQYSLIGKDATLSQGHTLQAEKGTYLLTGKDIDFSLSYKLTTEKGIYSFTGKDANLLTNYMLETIKSEYVLTGFDADLIYSAGLTHYTMVCSVGQYNLIGQDAALKINYKLSTSPGAYVLSGMNTNLLQQYKMTTSNASFSLIGKDVKLLHHYKTSVDTANFSLTGNDANLLQNYILSTSIGLYNLSGKNVNLKQSYKLTATKGEYILTGIDVDLIYNSSGLTHYIMQCETGVYTLSGNDANLYTCVNAEKIEGTVEFKDEISATVYFSIIISNQIQYVSNISGSVQF